MGGPAESRWAFSPSLMCMNLAKFEEQVTFLSSRAAALHFDIMDGHYVPALTLSPLVLSQVARFARIPIHAHLMVERPAQFLEETVKAGASVVSLHPETIQREVFRTLNRIEALGARPAIALNPETGVDTARAYLDRVHKITVMTVDPGFAGQPFIPAMLKKIEAIRTLKEREGHSFLIEADGACNRRTFRDLALAGTEVFVLGSSGLFDLDPDISRAWQIMEGIFREALGGAT
jgi:D-allulose-6-phosphate 3-epimerase